MPHLTNGFGLWEETRMNMDTSNMQSLGQTFIPHPQRHEATRLSTEPLCCLAFMFNNTINWLYILKST